MVRIRPAVLAALTVDVGAPVVSGSTGLSIVIGGSSTCSGSTVYAQPIVPLLTAWGRTIYQPPGDRTIY